jgi:hypothetical protein
MSRDDEKGDRPRRSWREIDAMRGRSRHTSSSEPRGPAARERSRAATQHYLKQLDGLFSKAKGGAQGERLEKAVRDAFGTPEMAAACRAYREALGLPEDTGLLTLFLDARDPEILSAVLDALHAAQRSGTLRATSGLRTQLRLLLQEPDDRVAESAEELLAKL